MRKITRFSRMNLIDRTDVKDMQDGSNLLHESDSGTKFLATVENGEITDYTAVDLRGETHAVRVVEKATKQREEDEALRKKLEECQELLDMYWHSETGGGCWELILVKWEGEYEWWFISVPC